LGALIAVTYLFLQPIKGVKYAIYATIVIFPLLTSYNFSPIESDLKITPILRGYLNTLTLIIISDYCIRINNKNFYYLCCGMLWQPIFTFLVYATVNSIFSDDSYRFSGANIFASSIMCAIPYLFLLNKDKFTMFYKLLVFPASILTFSRMLFIYYGIAFLIRSFSQGKNYNKLISFVFITFIILIIINFGEERASSNSERWSALESSIQAFIRFPYFGVGFGGWESIYNLYPPIDNLLTVTSEGGVISAMNPHNSFARVLCDLGIFGLGFFILIFHRIILVYVDIKHKREYEVYYFLVWSSLLTQIFLSDILEQLSAYILIISPFLLSKIKQFQREL